MMELIGRFGEHSSGGLMSSVSYGGLFAECIISISKRSRVEMNSKKLVTLVMILVACVSAASAQFFMTTKKPDLNCTKDEECHFLANKALCGTDPATGLRECRCRPGFLLDDHRNECRPILFATKGDCTWNENCVLGADCRENHCQCRPGTHYSRGYGMCIKDLRAGDRCEMNRDECVHTDSRGVNHIKCMSGFCRWCGSDWALSERDACPDVPSSSLSSLELGSALLVSLSAAVLMMP